MSKALYRRRSSPRVARVSKRRASDLLVQRRGAWCSLFFFTVIARRPPSFSRTHTSSSLPTNPFPQVVERRRKDHNKTKENKIVLSPIKKRAGLLALFSSRGRRYFFSRRKYLDPPLFFSLLYTLNVPKTLNKKFKKKRVVVFPKSLSVFCVCVSLSLSRLKSNHVARPKAEEQQQQHTASSSS